MSAETRTTRDLILIGVILTLSAHLALVFTGHGVALFQIATSLQVGLGLLLQRPLPAGVSLGTLPVYLTVLVLLLLVFIAVWVSVAIWVGRRYGKRGRRMEGTVTAGQVRKQNRKTLAQDDPFGYVNGVPFHLTTEDSVTAVAMAGSGKTMRLVVQMIRRAKGAVVTTSTRLDVLLLTAGFRRKEGNVLVFGPEYKILARWRRRCHWDIIDGCADTSVAMERADAIVAARPLGDGATNTGFFASAAGTVLRCMMHAAALGDVGTGVRYTMRDVVSWLQDFSDDTPYTILQTHPNANRSWYRELKRFCRGEAAETRNNTEQTISIILKALAIDAILDAVCPAEGVTMLNLDAFVGSTDTLYLLSKKKGLAAPVITALVESLQSKAMDAGEEAPLDPVLTMVMDELCNVCPMPSAPALMTDGRGHGVQTAAILQGRKQCVQRFGENGADTIINLSSALVIFGGSRDITLLQELSALADERDVERVSTSSSDRSSSVSTSTQKERVATVGALHTLEEGTAALFYRNLPMATISLPAWWESADKAVYEASQDWVRQELGASA